jgi:phage I-like protein
MNDLNTRIGGERETRAGKLSPSFVIDTADAPALKFAAGPNPAESSTSAPDEAAPSAPEWIELIPAGVFYGRDGRGPFRTADADALIQSTNALAMKAGLPIDYDHATDFGAPEGRPAPAAGWIRELQVRDGAVWGRVEWTARAAQSIVAREYRYISPVFQFDPTDGTVTRLLRAGLTNNPNLHLTAIAAAKTVAASDKDSSMEMLSHELCEALGLEANATPEQVIATARAMRAASERAQAGAVNAAALGADPAHYVAVAQFERALTELNALKAERALDRASLIVEDAIRAGKLVPAQREWAVAYCAADSRGFLAFVAKQPSILGPARCRSRVSLHRTSAAAL